MGTFDRIRNFSTEKANKRIDEETLKDIDFNLTEKERIGNRINKLDKEWDVDRAVTLNFSIVAGIGMLLGFFVNKKWFLLPALQLPFLAFHAVKGWCPPAPVFRLLKFRSRQEIDAEKTALKVARGDFRNIENADADYFASFCIEIEKQLNKKRT